MAMKLAILALTLAVLPQDAFEGSGTMGADGFTPDGSTRVLKLDTKETFEGRVWLRGRLAGDTLKVAEFERIPKDLGADAVGKDLEVSITEVYPWCDHMPSVGKPPERRYLVVSLKLANKSVKPRAVELARVLFSFEDATLGTAVKGLSVRGEGGMGTGETSVKLAAGKSCELQLRGDGLYPEGSEGKTLHVTLVFAAGNDRLVVRRGGKVSQTQ